MPRIPIIQAEAIPQGSTELCEFDIADYEVPKYENMVYTWEIVPPEAGYFLSGQGSHQVTVAWQFASNPQLRVSYRHKLMDCGGEGSLSVLIRPKPSFNGPGRVCEKGEALYEGVVDDYAWNIINHDDFVIEDGLNAAITWDITPGNYTLRATPINPDVFCMEYAEMDISVVALPPPPQIEGLDTICPGHPYVYQISSVLPNNLPEFVAQNGIIIAQSPEEVTVVWDDTTALRMLSARQVSTDELACESEWEEFTVNGPNGFEIEGTNALCVNEAAVYSAMPIQEGAYYQWSIEPESAGSITAGQGSETINVQWNATAGSAVLQLSSCGLQATYNVELFPLPEPEIIAPTNTFCKGTAVSLSATETYSTYQWRNEQNQIIGVNTTLDITQGGVYTLRVSDQNGCMGTALVEVDALPSPINSISRNGHSTICIQEPHNVTLYALANEGYEYEWYLNGVPMGINEPIIVHEGDATVGTFVYQLIVRNQWDCVTDFSDDISISQIECTITSGGIGFGGGSGTPTPCIIDPTASVAAVAEGEVCGEFEFSAITTGDATSLQWNFGDGTPPVVTSPTETVTHGFSEVGFHNILVRAFYPSLSAAFDSCHIITYVDVIQPLQIDFTRYGKCIADTIRFYNTSVHVPTTEVTTMEWDFGDGSPAVSGFSSPSHVYDAAGTYEATFTIGNDTCFATLSKEVVIYGLPDASFDIPQTLCPNEPIRPLSSSDLVLFEWDFGNDVVSTDSEPANSYTEPGFYTISLNASDFHGCSDTYQTEVEVLIPDVLGEVTAGNNPFCPGDSAALSAPAGTAWLWSNGATEQMIYTDLPGNYHVTISDTNGCTSTAESPLLSSYALPPSYLSPSLLEYDICGMDSLHIRCNNENEAYEYLWSTGDTGGILNFGLPGNEEVFELFVLVTDTLTGCADTSEIIVVYNHAMPEEPIIEGDLSICEGESTTLTVSHPDVDNVVWSNGHTGTSITTESPGFFTASYTSPEGCTATSGLAEVRVHPFPDLCVFPQGCHTLCIGDTLCVPDLFVNYQWLRNGNPIGFAGNEHFYIPTQAGDYALELTTNFGCERTTETVSISMIDCSVCDLNLLYLEQICEPEECSPAVTATFIIENAAPPIVVGGTAFEGVLFDNALTLEGLEPDSLYEITITDALDCTLNDLFQTTDCPDIPDFEVIDTFFCQANGQYDVFLQFDGSGPFYIEGDLSDTIYDIELLIPDFASGTSYNFSVTDSLTDCSTEIASSVITCESVCDDFEIYELGIVCNPQEGIASMAIGVDGTPPYQAFTADDTLQIDSIISANVGYFVDTALIGSVPYSVILSDANSCSGEYSFLPSDCILEYVDTLILDYTIECDLTTLPENTYGVSVEIIEGNGAWIYQVEGEPWTNFSWEFPIGEGFELTYLDPFGHSATISSPPVFCGDPFVPVELLDFSGKVLAPGNLLQWKTATEINADYYELYFSSNGNNFERLTKLSAVGNSSTTQAYEFLHQNAPDGLSYYRLSQTDMDGTSKGLGTVSLLREGERTNLNVFPSPARERLGVSLYAATANTYIGSIFDASGQLLHTFDYDAAKGSNEFEVDLLHFPEGIYLLQLVSDGGSFAVKFVKR